MRIFIGGILIYIGICSLCAAMSFAAGYGILSGIALATFILAIVAIIAVGIILIEWDL